MIINLIKSARMFSLTLPQKIKGKYWVTDLDDDNNIRNLISIEAQDDRWIVKSNKTASIVDPATGDKSEAVLTNETFLNVKIADSDEEAILFTEDVDLSRQTLTRINITDADILFIGRDPSNNLFYNNPFVSGQHAKLAYDGSDWSITDLGSRNGTYVNGYRIQSQKLNPGDFIYIMGLKIVVSGGFIALNNPGEKLKIKASSLELLSPEKHIQREPEIVNNDNYFSRSPRFHREIKDATIVIDPPPAPPKIDSVPLALMLGPSITMGMTSVSTGILTMSNVMASGGNIRQALPTLIMSFSMLLGTILWPILTKKYEKKQKLKAEKERQEKYLAYLSEIGDRIRSVNREQCEILNANLVTQEECAERIAKTKDNLWERVIGQSDFLRIRLGIGSLPARLELKYPEKKFTMEDDTLQNAMLSLAEEPKVLKPVPISVSLTDCIAAGVYGNKLETDNMIKVMIMQMISLHSYDELKIMLVTNDANYDTWSFVKNIPHFWNNERTVRFFATTDDDTKELSAYIEKMIIPRAEINNAAIEDMSPYYVIIVTDKQMARKFGGLQLILNNRQNLGCSIIFAHEKISDFPKETSKVILADGSNSLVFDKNDTTGGRIGFTADSANEAVINHLSGIIANIELDIDDSNYSLPSMLTFLEMFNVGKVEHLNSLTRWKENNPTKSLQTPIGVDTFGDLFTLDLHEKFHGPHGLVAGMTGSGKSEFLITFILSLAVNYHPDEVSFILIDYKGGGLAGAFEDKEKGIKLPHLAGVITNLDGSAINRTLVSFQSERRRREAILNRARKTANEGTMDIYKYQQLYRDKVVTEPLPHLFIIADEFAELKAQQPDFMQQLISLARVGRSLGIHLILATQKPNGVVDDQIWSNSKFRVCLKVQEKADSQDMIKRPDAAELSHTGRFYLQVGFNEFFALGQSAWCGADYVPVDTVEKAVDNSIQVIDNIGRPIINVRPPKKTAGTNSIKQIVAIVNYLSFLADEEHISVRSLWLDPIPAVINVADVEEKYGYNAAKFELNPVIGEYDDPFNQRQGMLTVPFVTDGNCLVYGSTGNGKTTFITTLVYSLIKHHSAAEVNIYIMDFGSETMKSFEKAPQVGDVILTSNAEKVNNLFKMLKRELEERKIKFSDFGGDYCSYCHNGHYDTPNIVVILNNYSAFVELYEDYQDEFTILSRDASKYGVYFVVTAGSTNAVRYRTQQNFKMIFTMQLNDATDYAVIVGKTDGLTPSKFKGRGLVALDKVYEFQTAYCSSDGDVLEYIRQYCLELAQSSPITARPVPVLPDAVTYDFVAASINTSDSIPVGVNKSTLDIATINLEAVVVYPILSQDIEYIAAFANVFGRVCADVCKTTIIDTEKMLDTDVAVTLSEQYESFVKDLFDEMVVRNNLYKDSNLNKEALKDYEEQIIVIVGIKKFIDMLSSDGKDKFLTLIDKAEAFYKIHFVALETAAQFNTLCFEARIKNKLAQNEGVWIGDGVVDQYLLKINKITSDLYEEIGGESGYQISRGRPKSIKMLSNGEDLLNG